MISIDGFHTGSREGYACYVSGNGGENEFIVIMSPSQARATPLIIIHAHIDGGAKVVLNTDFIDYPTVLDYLRSYLKEWVKTGDSMTKMERDRQFERAEKMARVICEYYHLPV